MFPTGVSPFAPPPCPYAHITCHGPSKYSISCHRPRSPIKHASKSFPATSPKNGAVVKVKAQEKSINLKPNHSRSLPITSFPPKHSQRLIVSLRFEITHILERYQHVEMAVDSEVWILDFLGPLQRAVWWVLISVKLLAPHQERLECLLAETESAGSRGTPGREAFRTLLRNN